MAGLTQIDFGRRAGVSQQAVGKAVARGYLVRDEDGRLDPRNRTNAAWLKLHRAGSDDRGSPLNSYSGGRPPRPASAGARKAISPTSGTSRRNASVAATLTTLSDAELDATLVRLGEDLRLDETYDIPGLDAALRQRMLRAPSDWSVATVGGFLDHVVDVVAGFLKRQDEALNGLLASFDQRLERIEKALVRDRDRP